MTPHNLDREMPPLTRGAYVSVSSPNVSRNIAIASCPCSRNTRSNMFPVLLRRAATKQSCTFQTNYIKLSPPLQSSPIESTSPHRPDSSRQIPIAQRARISQYASGYKCNSLVPFLIAGIEAIAQKGLRPERPRNLLHLKNKLVFK
jgi:hypothetical protein